MISCVYLGNYGRHGNQMFQYAMTLSLSKKFDTIAVAPIENTTIKDCFVLGDVQNAVPQEVHGRYEEPNFGFDESVYDLPKEANIDLLGYFQTEKYFKDYEDDIRKNFEFRDNIKSQAELWKKSMPIMHDEKTVSIHVRRGDYLELSDFHPTCEVSYYDDAMKNFEGYTPLIFSDDMAWCRENLSHHHPIFVEDNDLNVDMCLMSMCDGHIISNSSFSWWAAWLGNKKNVVAPKTWFGPAGPQDWEDIYCEGWILC